MDPKFSLDLAFMKPFKNQPFMSIAYGILLENIVLTSVEKFVFLLVVKQGKFTKFKRILKIFSDTEP